MKNPLVSVVMPVYNTQEFVAEAIESILKQTYTNFEFIIIDDGSTDNSYAIVKKYASLDKRIIHYTRENIGLVKTRIELLEKLSTYSKYMVPMDSDDVSFSNRIKKQIEFLELNNDIAAVGANMVYIDKNGKELGNIFYEQSFEKICKTILRKSPIGTGGATIRLSALHDVGGYDVTFERAQDYDLRVRLWKKGRKLANIDDFSLKYRIFEGQGKSKFLKLTLRNTLRIQGRHIFCWKHFNLLNTFNFLAELALYVLPSKFVLYLFRRIKGIG